MSNINNKSENIAKILVAVAVIVFVSLNIYLGIKAEAEKITPIVTGSGENVVCCVGDSITYGRGLKQRKTEAYPSVLQGLLGEDYTTHNYGYSRRCAINDADYPYVKEEYYTKTLELNADIYIIMLGTNDTKSYNWDATAYHQDLKNIVDSYKMTGAKVYLMQPPACFTSEGSDTVAFDIDGQIVAKELQQIVAQVAADSEVSLIDLYTPTKDHKEWFADGVHPNAEGAQELAKIIYENVK